MVNIDSYKLYIPSIDIKDNKYNTIDTVYIAGDDDNDYLSSYSVYYIESSSVLHFETIKECKEFLDKLMEKINSDKEFTNNFIFNASKDDADRYSIVSYNVIIKSYSKNIYKQV